MDMYYPDIGDSTADSGLVLIATDKGATSAYVELKVVIPPSIGPNILSSFIYALFCSMLYCWLDIKKSLIGLSLKIQTKCLQYTSKGL